MHFQESTPSRASHNSWQDCNLRWGHSISNPPVVYWSWVNKNVFGYRLCFSVFFGTWQRESPLTQASLGIFFAWSICNTMQCIIFSAMELFRKNSDGGFKLCTRQPACLLRIWHVRVSAMVKTCFADAENHSTRIIVYDVPIILGHIYHRIHQSNICIFEHEPHLHIGQSD